MNLNACAYCLRFHTSLRRLLGSPFKSMMGSPERDLLLCQEDRCVACTVLLSPAFPNFRSDCVSDVVCLLGDRTMIQSSLIQRPDDRDLLRLIAAAASGH